MVNWTKHITREMSLTAISYAFNSYTGGLSSLLFSNLNNIIYFNNEGQIEGYKDPDELKRLKTEMAEMARQKPESIKTTLHMSKMYSDDLNDFISNAAANLQKYSDEELALLYKNFDSLYSKFWIYYIFHFHLTDALQEANLQNILKENEALINELRKTNPYLVVDQEFLKHFFNELSIRKGINNPELLYYLLPNEVMGFLEGNFNINMEDLEQRRKNFLFLSKDGRKITRSGAEALMEKNREVMEKEAEIPQELKGTAAYNGKVIGKVKVVMRKSDFGKIKDKDVLVAHMTTTDYTPYLNKVSAIITDEGGLGCHAAILSREFKIPCIIGVKIATKVLKDGDLVEVDADKGIIKKL